MAVSTGASARARMLPGVNYPELRSRQLSPATDAALARLAARVYRLNEGQERLGFAPLPQPDPKR